MTVTEVQAKCVVCDSTYAGVSHLGPPRENRVWRQNKLMSTPVPHKIKLPPPEGWRRRWAKILPTTADVPIVVECRANQRLGRAQAMSMNDNLLCEELKLPLRIRGEVPLGFEDKHRENRRTRHMMD